VPSGFIQRQNRRINATDTSGRRAPNAALEWSESFKAGDELQDFGFVSDSGFRIFVLFRPWLRLPLCVFRAFAVLLRPLCLLGCFCRITFLPSGATVAFLGFSGNCSA
jgi:hypothetical protein